MTYQESEQAAVFDTASTTQAQVLVEYVSDTGSGFGVTPEGDTVFLNSRLMDRMKVKPGDIYNAFLLPNYEDKRGETPWRAMRVEAATLDPHLKNVILNSKDQSGFERRLVVDYMKEYGGVSTTFEISTATGIDPDKVELILNNNKTGSALMFMKVDAYMLLSEDN